MHLSKYVSLRQLTQSLPQDVAGGKVREDILSWPVTERGRVLRKKRGGVHALGSVCWAPTSVNQTYNTATTLLHCCTYLRLLRGWCSVSAKMWQPQAATCHAPRAATSHKPQATSPQTTSSTRETTPSQRRCTHLLWTWRQREFQPGTSREPPCAAAQAAVPLESTCMCIRHAAHAMSHKISPASVHSALIRFPTPPIVCLFVLRCCVFSKMRSGCDRVAINTSVWLQPLVIPL